VVAVVEEVTEGAEVLGEDLPAVVAVVVWALTDVVAVVVEEFTEVLAVVV
jgi:hypothetical protein